MPEKIVKLGRRNRITFSKIGSQLELPNLIEIQKKSFESFIQSGFEEALREIFPITDSQENFILEFVKLYIDKINISIEDAKKKDLNYARTTRAKLRLINKQTGEISEKKIFLGDLPVMTEAGSFIINGAERVVVSQLVRSPGVYFNYNKDNSETNTIQGTIIPNRGSWIEYEIDIKGFANVRIDRTRRLPLTIFLRALGLSSSKKIIDLFGKSDLLELSFSKESNNYDMDTALIELYKRLRPGEPTTLDNAKAILKLRFFNKKRYNLAEVGRFKLNKKLSIAERIYGLFLAEDIYDSKGKCIFEKGTELIGKAYTKLQKYLSEGINVVQYGPLGYYEDNLKLQIIKVYKDLKSSKIINVIGTYSLKSTTLEIADIIASISYFLNIHDGVGNIDDIDHLANRRVRSVGELLYNHIRIGLLRMERAVRERMTIQNIDELNPQSLINIRPLTAIIKEFFGSSQLSQFMDQHNPLAEITHKRRLSALGPGGLSRDRAGFEVRDVHYTHYGRICPIETPEGANIGLINSLATYARVDQYGFLQTPFRKVKNRKISNTIVYLSADEEDNYIVAPSTVPVSKEGLIEDMKVSARIKGEQVSIDADKIQLIDISPKQMVSIAAACTPFLEHDDASRALMGSNMQRQAVPLMIPEAPLVATGIEHIAAKDSGVAIIAKNTGIVEYSDAVSLIVRLENNKKDHYKLYKYNLSNHGVSYNHHALVKVGEKVHKGEIIADGVSMDKGELSLGRNVVVAFMTWNGYNYEDAIIMSNRLVQDNVYTSIHIEEYEIECRDTKLGKEEITREILNVSEFARKDLDEEGIIRVGAEVTAGTILVGKVTPKGITELSPEERLLHAIFGEKAREVRDSSLRVPHGGEGTVIDVKVFTRKDGNELKPGVNKVVRVYIAQKRKISEGDKMAGRHGNKGVISRILPIEDMPYMEDGTPIDIMLNPLGVPSRMNIGQILELHLGMAAKKLGVHYASPVFDGCTIEEMKQIMKKAGMSEDGKYTLYDGRTGEKFDNRISVGVMYMIKLAHMVDDKLHSRSNGPYSLVTQQPLGGKAQFGGQRFGEMEVWALEAYGAANTLQEMLTIKSDDIIGRKKAYESIITNRPVVTSGIPESFRVLVKELQSLAIDVSIFDKENNIINFSNLIKE